MNEMAWHRPAGRATARTEHARPHTGSEAAGGWTRLRARWFVGNARRDGRRRVERLYEVSLWRAVGVRGSNGRRQTHAMARSTVATPVALVRSTIIVVPIDLGIVMTAFNGRVATVVVIGGQRTCRSRAARIRAAKRHGCRSVCLKRHREHHEPQQDCAKANHWQIIGGGPRVSFPYGKWAWNPRPGGTRLATGAATI